MAVGKMGKVCQCLTIMTNKYILQISQYIFVLQLCFLSAKLVKMQYQCQCILLIVSAAYISTAKTQHLDNSFLSNNLLSVVKHNTKHYFELHNRSRLSQNLYYCEEICIIQNTYLQFIKFLSLFGFNTIQFIQHNMKLFLCIDQLLKTEI